MYCAGVWIAQDAFVSAGHCVDDIGMPQMEKRRRALLDEDDPPPPPGTLSGRA